MKMDCRTLRRIAFCAEMEQNCFNAGGMENIRGVCNRLKTGERNFFFFWSGEEGGWGSMVVD